MQTLLEEGYAELWDEAKRLEQEFEQLDVESLKYIELYRVEGNQTW